MFLILLAFLIFPRLSSLLAPVKLPADVWTAACWSEVETWCCLKLVFYGAGLFRVVVFQEPCLQGPLPPHCSGVGITKHWLVGELSDSVRKEQKLQRRTRGNNASY